MAKSFTMKATVYFLLLAIFLGCANSARILDEVDPQPPIVADPPEVSDGTDVPDVPPTVGSTITTLPSGQFPASSPSAILPEVDPPQPEVEAPEIVTSPNTNVAPISSPITTSPIIPVKPPLPEDASPETTVVAPVTGPITTSPSGPAQVATTGATVAHAPLSFFMHDILGGTHPSARVVTGIVANSAVNGLPFSKPSNPIFPLNGGVPLPNNLNGIINNNNNLPFLTGLNGGQTTAIIQNNGNNNVVGGGNNQPFVTAGNLPAGATLEKLMFGSVTVIDDELTEGHELGSAVVGKAQGFYLASSLDGTSQTVALTTLFHSGNQNDHHEVVDDTICFFGVHRTASPESQVTVVGGTGKYMNAKGYATIETLHHDDQHTTDGVDTILQFNVYLTH